MDVARMMRAELTPAEQAVIMARRAEERADRQAERDEAERRAQLEDQREARLFAASQAGLTGRSITDLADAASRMADEDDQYQEALRVIARTEKRREARRAQAAWQAEQTEMLSRAGTGREPPGLQHANELAARLRVETMLTGPQGRRPFVRRGGAAVRSDADTDHALCVECAKAGASASESALIHLDPSPPPVPDDWEQQPYCRDCGALADWCKCATGTRYQPVRAGGRVHLYDKRYGEMIYR